jgi:chromosome segregation ATPase
MANENIERQMEFIIEQQALFAAKMPQLEENVRQLEDIVVRFAKATLDRFEATDARVDDVDEKIAALVDSHLRAQERGREIDEKIAALVDSQVRAQERGREIDEKIAALVDSQLHTEQNVKRTEENVKKTDEALRSLTTVVDRYISERRNGNSKG